MSNGQDQSDVPLPVIPDIPITSGATDKPDAPQSAVPSVVSPTQKTVKPFGTTPQKVDYDPNFPLLSKSKGFKEAMAKYGDEPGPEESTLPKSVIMQRNLNVMENSPIYKQANNELRLKLQMAFYKQYVEPLARLDAATVPQGQMRGQRPLTLKDWLKARGEVWLREHPNPKVQTSDLSKFGLGAAHEFVLTGAGATDIASQVATHSQWDNLKKDWFNLKEQIGAASAMLEAQMTPHMGPILIQADHKALENIHYNPNIPGMGMKMDDLYKASQYAQHNYYRDTAYDQLLLKGGGRMLGMGTQLHIAGMAGGLRALDKSVLMAEQTPEDIAALRKLYAGGKLFGRFGVYATDVAKNSVQEAAKGYLVGTEQRGGKPLQEALSWGLGTAVLAPIGTLIGKLRIWGDQEVTDEMLQQAVDDYLSKHPTSQVTPVAVAMAGSPGQKISRALMEALNKETKGAFWKAPLSAKQSTLKALAAKYPELAANAGWLDEHLTELQAAHETAQWRELMPEVDNALKKIEAIDGTPTVKTIAKEVAEKQKAEALKNSPPGTVAKAMQDPKDVDQRVVQHILRTDAVRAKIKAEGGQTKAAAEWAKEIFEGGTGGPGAASAGSLEFGDNFTKHVDTRLDALGLGKDKYVWESRGHKLLFYLNVLASETKAQGPSTDRSREAQLLLHQLTQEFPGKNLKELLAMSDTLWTKISNLEKGGFVKPGVPTRIWRQTHLGPGESPFAHEVDLLQKAAKADRAKRVEAAKAAKVAKQEAAAKAKTEKAEKIEKAPTESKEFQTAAQAYVAALKKLGYNNDDISKMTPQQLVEIISKKTPKISPKVAEVSAKAAEKPMTDEEKLAAAFKKSADVGTGQIDTKIQREVMERMFPDVKDFRELTPSEQSEVMMTARKLQISRMKGKQ